MKLKEKLRTVVTKQLRSGEDHSEDLEHIADEFAIGFAEFSINYNYHPTHKVWIRYDKLASEKFSTKELLEIFKKEKGL